MTPGAISMLQVRDISPREWSENLQCFGDVTLEQSLTFAQHAAARLGAAVRLMAVESDTRLLGAAAIRLRRIPVLGRGIAWLPSGPLTLINGFATPDAAHLTDILNALRHQLCDREGHILRLRLPGIARYDTALARDAATAAGFLPYPAQPPSRSYALDLTQKPDTLLAGMSGKWRTDLRFGLKSGMTLQCGADRDLQERFLALFARVQQAKGFRPNIFPDFHFDMVTSRNDHPDYALEILIAAKDGKDVAGIVVGRAGHTATYLYGATDAAGRPLRAGYVLTWQAILQSQERGLHWYDLGGVDVATNPDVARFKERMGGLWITAEVFQAQPEGLMAKAIIGLEQLRARLRP